MNSVRRFRHVSLTVVLKVNFVTLSNINIWGFDLCTRCLHHSPYRSCLAFSSFQVLLAGNKILRKGAPVFGDLKAHTYLAVFFSFDIYQTSIKCTGWIPKLELRSITNFLYENSAFGLAKLKRSRCWFFHTIVSWNFNFFYLKSRYT